MASRAAPMVVSLLAVAALAGCLGGGLPKLQWPPVWDQPPNECDFDTTTHEVRLEVAGVEARLSSAEIHDGRGGFGIAACAFVSTRDVLEATGPHTARGNVTGTTDVDQLWLFFDRGLMRLGTNGTVDGSGTLELHARGPPGGSADLRWAREAAEIRWLEWHDDPTALADPKASTGGRPLEDANGTLAFPVNSLRNSGVEVGFGADVNASRHPTWSSYEGPRQGVRVNVTLVAPNGSEVAWGNWTPNNGTAIEEIHHPGDAAGEWTVRYRVQQGQADPQDLLYWVDADVRYGVPHR